VLADGSTACWGDLALATFPLPVSHLVAAFALLSDGSLFTRHGLRIDGIDHVTDASQSSQGLKMPSACAVTSDTSLYCWGSNDFGQLGDGTTQERTAPTLVGNGFLQVVQTPDNTNDAAACALTTVGSLVCWGQTVGALTPVALGVTSVQQLVVQPSASPAVTDILGQFYALTVDGTIIELSLTGGKPLTIQ